MVSVLLFPLSLFLRRYKYTASLSRLPSQHNGRVVGKTARSLDAREAAVRQVTLSDTQNFIPYTLSVFTVVN